MSKIQWTQEEKNWIRAKVESAHFRRKHNAISDAAWSRLATEYKDEFPAGTHATRGPRLNLDVRKCAMNLDGSDGTLAPKKRAYNLKYNSEPPENRRLPQYEEEDGHAHPASPWTSLAHLARVGVRSARERRAAEEEERERRYEEVRYHLQQAELAEFTDAFLDAGFNSWDDIEKSMNDARSRDVLAQAVTLRPGEMLRLDRYVEQSLARSAANSAAPPEFVD